MPSKLKISLSMMKRALIALFALAQLFPAGFAFASDGDGVSIVICNPNGAKVLSWEALTGEPSPYASIGDPFGDDGHGDEECRMCVVGGCAGVGLHSPAACLPGLNGPAADFTLPRQDIASSALATGPPMPSRAPPAALI